jgi:hypothetical protein
MAAFVRVGLIASLVIAALFGSSASDSIGDEPKKETGDGRAAHLKTMEDLAASVHVYGDQRGERPAIALQKTPVLRYTDNTRKTLESSLWIWADEGRRPGAVLAVEYYPEHQEGPRWLYEIASLSTGPILAEREGEFRWVAKDPGLKFVHLDDAGTPADKPAQRLVQMRELRDRFTAHERATIEGRIELRPLKAPLHRYASTKQSIVDGAIFAFCNGTNPEVLLVVEAQKDAEGKVAWHYALVQTTGEEVSAELDGKEVWKGGEAYPPADRGNYVNGWIEAGKLK